MSKSLFEEYIIGGGWAMLLLIPASIVAVATGLRGILLLLNQRDTREETHINRVLEPLFWVFVFAPVVGAIASLLRLFGITASSSAGAFALIPVTAGVLVGLISGILFGVLRVLTARNPGAGAERNGVMAGMLILPGCAALAVAFTCCLYVSRSAKRGQKENGAGSTPVLSLNWSTETQGNQPAYNTGAGNAAVPELLVRRKDYSLDGNALSPGDALFKLTGVAGRSDSIIVRAAADVSAARLTQGVALANQAGFLQVGLEAEDNTAKGAGAD